MAFTQKTYDYLRAIKSRWELRKLSGWEKIDGFLSPLEAIALFNYASLLPRGATACEIGSYKGKSTVCLAKGLLAAGAKKLIAIDAFDASGDPESVNSYVEKRGDLPLIDQFVKNVEDMGVRDIIEIKKGKSNEFVETIPSLDLLFIDADHSIDGCLADYESYSPKVKMGGLLMFHDYDPRRKDLGPTHVIETTVYPSLEWAFIEKYGTLWVGKRVNESKIRSRSL
ncbi:MAG TPA: class I SAM-dependent methyltransferase [Bacteroidota bacterium]|nr:class I SAM-dependent methyltransferase [Bacteroidota bacterium]